MRRRAFLELVGGAALGSSGLPGAIFAQSRTSPRRRIGVLTPALAQFDRGAFGHALERRGYSEAADIVLEVRSSDGELTRLPELAAKMASEKFDVIVAVNNPAARAILGTSRSVPVVMAMVSDPVALGLVTNLSRPGQGVTGVANVIQDLAPKRLAILKEAVPHAKRVAAFYNPDDPITEPQRRQMDLVAGPLGITVTFFPVRNAEETEVAFERALADGSEATFAVAGQTNSFAPKLAELSLRRRIPAAMVLRQHVEAGGLLSYFADIGEHWARVAALVDRILRGERPDELPVEQPTKFELVFNLKTAKALGLTIPPTLLARADDVIE